LLEESLALFRETGERRLIPEVLANLGLVWHEQGDDGRAAALLAESLALPHTGGPSMCSVLQALEGVAGVAGVQGQPERAARLFGATDVLRAALGLPVRPADRRRYDRAVRAVHAALGDATFAAAWAAGRALSLEHAIAEATDCLLSSTSASHCAQR
jgi:hypothetical protein